MSKEQSKKWQQLQELIRLSESVKKMDSNSQCSEHSNLEQSSFEINVKNQSNFFSEAPFKEKQEDFLEQSMRNIYNTASPVSQNANKQMKYCPEQFLSQPINLRQQKSNKKLNLNEPCNN